VAINVTGKQNTADPGALDASARLVQALAKPAAFNHPCRHIQILETHISWVLLTGDFAYKIKKPVKFGFLDFSTLPLRRHYCAEELRLNRRFAPQIYLEVVEIRGDPAAPRLHGEGEVIEYAVRMQQFPQQALLSAHAAAGTLGVAVVDAIAHRVSELHATSDRSIPCAEFGSAHSVQRWSEENLVQLTATIPEASMPVAYARLRDWYRNYQGLAQQLEQRRAGGHVRDCHGDLHLGNMALIDEQVVPFDCIEFNAELRWIDTISEAAFIAMDLEARGYPGFCWRFISRYLENSGDYDAVALLRYYMIYRALVRAKVEALSVAANATRDVDTFARAGAYIKLAGRWADRRGAGMILMHGLSGSGKSTVAAQLIESQQAIQLRSDVIRKQLFELAADADSGSAVDQGIYSAGATEATYKRLRQIAAQIIDCDFPVIVDATFLLQAQRRILLDLAVEKGCPCVAVVCNAPLEILRNRIIARDNDPSEASLQVLERQIQRHQPVSRAEAGISDIVMLDAEGLRPHQREQIETLLLRE
jgi:aminoglycoside phosphotransferase family enzyme/predicted kinase